MKTDSQLQHDVQAELEWEPSIDHAHIGVAVTAGVVTLTGQVSNYAQKLAAEKAVHRVAGVHALDLKIGREPQHFGQAGGARAADVLAIDDENRRRRAGQRLGTAGHRTDIDLRDFFQ